GRHHPAPRPGLPGRHRRRHRQNGLAAESGGGSELSVRSLSQSLRGGRPGNDVSFEVKRGEFLAMIGPNGAGKSTCFNMINGQLAPNSGEIWFEATNLAGLKPRNIWRLGV